MMNRTVLLVFYAGVALTGCKDCRLSTDCGAGERCHQDKCVSNSVEIPHGDTETADTSSQFDTTLFSTESAISSDSSFFDSGSESEFVGTQTEDSAGDTGMEDTGEIGDSESGDTGSDSETADDLWNDSETRNGIPASTVSDSVWVFIEGGTFEMGSEELPNASPLHAVRVDDFEIMKSEVTAGQYRRCVSEGECTEPREVIGETERTATYSSSKYRYKAVNYVSWQQAEDFCSWMGGFLPSEAQWEYAARSRGKDVNYPWGNSPAPDCKTGNYAWCIEDMISVDVCELSMGITEQSLCEMSGNMWEWTADSWHGNYLNAPVDDAPWLETPMEWAVIRGGGMTTDIEDIVTQYQAGVRARLGLLISESFFDLGFRCARSPQSAQ